MRRYRAAFWIAALAALLALGAYYVLRPRPVPAEVASIRRGYVETSVEAEATTRVRERFTVSAPVAGRLLRITLREGDRVRRGAIIAAIDPLPATAAVQQALAQLSEMHAQEAGVETLRPKNETLVQAQARESAAAAALAQARRDLIRVESLAGTGDLPKSQLEAAQLAEKSRALELAVAQAAVAETRAKHADPDYLLRVYRARGAAVEAQLRTLEDQARRTSIDAPVSGTVLRLHQKSEQSIAAGTPLLDIGDPRDLEIVADVLSEDAVTIRPGDFMLVERGAGSAPSNARVIRIDPSAHTKVSALGVEEQRVDVIGRFVSVPPGVSDRYRLDVRIVTWRAKALRVPTAALFRCGPAWCAYREVRGKARRATLTLGRRGVDYAQILSGLRENDRVILHPADNLDEGTALSVRAPEARQADDPE